jgi:hypothetical protein
MVSNNQGDTDNRFNGLSTFLFFNAACGKQLFSEKPSINTIRFLRVIRAQKLGLLGSF